MDYIRQINAFENWLEYNDLGAGPQLLWYKLMRVANLSGWQRELSIANTRLQSMTKSSEKTLINNRNQLIQSGLLQYKKRSRTKAGIYILTDITGNFTVKPTVDNTTTGNIPVDSTVKREVDWEVKPTVDPTVNSSAYINNTKLNKTIEPSLPTPPIDKNNINSEPEILEVDEVQKTKELYQLFEKEFGRPLSPIENESIGKWIAEDNYDLDVIRLALRESVLNQAYSLRYIDRILLEWERKGIKSKQQAEKAIVSRRNAKVAKQQPEPEEELPSISLHNWLNPEEDVT